MKELLYMTSINHLFFSAQWLEREVFDLFGIFFYNIKDLRRILTDYGFKGYPLRKSFPVVGYLQVRYDEIQKKIIIEPLTLTQDFRQMEFVSLWKDF